MARKKKQATKPLPTKEEVMKDKDRPFFLDYGYTVEEWQQRKRFENMYSEADQYAAYSVHGFSGDLSQFD